MPEDDPLNYNVIDIKHSEYGQDVDDFDKDLDIVPLQDL